MGRAAFAKLLHSTDSQPMIMTAPLIKIPASTEPPDMSVGPSTFPMVPSLASPRGDEPGPEFGNLTKQSPSLSEASKLMGEQCVQAVLSTCQRPKDPWKLWRGIIGSDMLLCRLDWVLIAS